MDLKHIDIANLSVSPANMRGKGRVPDLSNILPSVRARGVLVPLIVRQNGSPETYEIVAGKRRYHAALAVAEESGKAEPLPCAIMAAGDDGLLDLIRDREVLGSILAEVAGEGVATVLWLRQVSTLPRA